EHTRPGASRRLESQPAGSTRCTEPDDHLAGAEWSGCVSARAPKSPPARFRAGVTPLRCRPGRLLPFQADRPLRGPADLPSRPGGRWPGFVPNRKTLHSSLGTNPNESPSYRGEALALLSV